MSPTLLLRSLFEAMVPSVDAHCDTADGPAVTTGARRSRPATSTSR